jgi:lactoylglutathione lyase
MSARPKLLGVNHVALEVGDLDEALEFYGRLFQFELRGRMSGMAFLDMGDQFLALSEGRTQPSDTDRHFGLVVDDKEAVREALREAGVDPAPCRGLNFRDIQFTKAPNVLRGMGSEGLEKRQQALDELRDKGLL